MADLQIKELLEEVVPKKEKEPERKPIPAPPPAQNKPSPAQTKLEQIPDRSSEDLEAANILSAEKPPTPKKPEPKPTGDSAVLKTRKDLIDQIKKVAGSRGEDVKKLNLGRRRKNSLQGILKEQLQEAVRSEMEPDIAPEVAQLGLDNNQEFVVNMCFRFDLTMCKLLERGIDGTSGWHGLTCDGFSESIEENECLSSEIRSCWAEIISEPENAWIVESCSASMRLFLAHCYPLCGTLRAKKARTLERKPFRAHHTNVQKTNPIVVPRADPERFRNSALCRAAKRKVNPHSQPANPRARIVVKSV